MQSLKTSIKAALALDSIIILPIKEAFPIFSPDLTQIFIWCAVFLSLLFFTTLFFSPFKFVLRAALKTFGGFCWLAVINAACSFAGVSLGFNIFNAAVIALLGLPGAALLLLSRWALLL